MASPSVIQHYTINEFQLPVQDSPVVPVEIQPFLGISFRCSSDIFRVVYPLQVAKGSRIPTHVGFATG